MCLQIKDNHNCDGENSERKRKEQETIRRIHHANVNSFSRRLLTTDYPLGIMVLLWASHHPVGQTEV